MPSKTSPRKTENGNEGEKTEPPHIEPPEPEIAVRRSDGDAKPWKVPWNPSPAVPLMESTRATVAALLGENPMARFLHTHIRRQVHMPRKRKS